METRTVTVMTPELLAQRRWQHVADLIEAITTSVIVPVVMPHSEGGGIMIIHGNRAFHFTNCKVAVNVNVSEADTGLPIEGRRNCFRFDQSLEETVKKVCGEIIT